MGYRSDVTVAIYPDDRKQEGYDALKMLMGTTFKDVMFDDCMTWHDNKCALVYNLINMKWYDSYPEIQAFLRMLASLAGETEDGIGGYNYEMVRLGENADDIEFSNGGEYLEYFMSVSRVVDINI